MGDQAKPVVIDMAQRYEELLIKHAANVERNAELEAENYSLMHQNSRNKHFITELEDNQAGERCDHCGCDRIYSGPPDCPRCGAPNCCEVCCNEQTQADRIAELEERLRVEQSCNRCKQYHGKDPCEDVAELQATIEQTRELVDLYFEGCASDTFDDAVRALRKALADKPGGESE